MVSGNRRFAIGTFADIKKTRVPRETAGKSTELESARRLLRPLKDERPDMGIAHHPFVVDQARVVRPAQAGNDLATVLEIEHKPAAQASLDPFAVGSEPAECGDVQAAL